MQNLAQGTQPRNSSMHYGQEKLDFKQGAWIFYINNTSRLLFRFLKFTAFTFPCLHFSFTPWGPDTLNVKSAIARHVHATKSSSQRSHKFFFLNFGNGKIKINSVAWVHERTIPIESPPLVGDVSPKFWGKVTRGQRDGSLRPYSRISRPEPLLFLLSSSSIALTRLRGPSCGNGKKESKFNLVQSTS
jgi:hypothetical protein